MASQNFQLVMRAGPTPGKTFSLSKNEILIGRDISADVVINAAEVSRRHAHLRMDAGMYVIEDMGSTNGTFINGQRLTSPHVLRPGEVIMLGEAVSLAYEATQYDPNATMVSPSSSRADETQLPPASAEVYKRQTGPLAQPAPAYVPPSQPAPAPAYANQVPASHAADYDEPEGGKKGISWIWAGVGCLVVVVCLVIVGVLAFDMFDLYCKPPFDSILGFLYSCP